MRGVEPSISASDTPSRKFGRQSTDVVALYESQRYRATDPEFADAVTAVLDDIAEHDDVESVTSYYDTQQPSFVSSDEHATYASITLTGQDDA